jgi:hypothetical protein
LNAEYSRANILTELLPLRPRVDGKRLGIHADKARLHTARKCRAFAKKIGSASPDTHRTHLISHYPTSFSSDISNNVCRESLFHHVKSYLQQFMKSSRPSRDQHWRTCFGNLADARERGRIEELENSEPTQWMSGPATVLTRFESVFASLQFPQPLRNRGIGGS